MASVSIYVKTSGVVALTKDSLSINTRNEDLTDEQIARICRSIAEAYAPDTTYEYGKPKFGEIGISIMLSVSLYVFPWHYQKYELWQRN